jgi:predicted MFS family arabinose efflux permease
VAKEDLQNAIALNSIQFNLARVVGPALGGLALVKLGAKWCFALNGLSFLAVIASLLAIRPNFVPAKTQQSVIKSMREGIDFLLKRDGMISLVALGFLATLLSYPLITFLPVMAREVFHGGPNTFTLFRCLSGAGSVSGALLVAGSSGHVGQAKKSLLVMLVLGFLITAFGLSRNLALSGLLIFVAGASLMIVFALNSSLVQLYVTDQMRGRVMSVYNVAFRGGMPLGSVISGLLIKQSSAPVIMAVNGFLVVVMALGFLLRDRKLVRL